LEEHEWGRESGIHDPDGHASLKKKEKKKKKRKNRLKKNNKDRKRYDAPEGRK